MWPRRAVGGVAAGPPRDAGQAGAQLPRQLPPAAGRLSPPACAPPRRRRPREEFAAPASRALAVGSAFVRSRRAPPPPPPECGRAAAKSEPRALRPAPYAPRRAASCWRGAPRGRGARQKKEKQRGWWAFVCANLITSSFLT